MNSMSVYLDARIVRRFMIKYIAISVLFAALGAISVLWVWIQWNIGRFGFQDFILILVPLVAVFADYGFIQMILAMHRNLASGSPVLVLEQDAIQLEGQSIPIKSITKIVQHKDVTFVYATGVKRFVRILPYMRGEYGHAIDAELVKRWNEQKAQYET